MRLYGYLRLPGVLRTTAQGIRSFPSGRLSTNVGHHCSHNIRLYLKDMVVNALAAVYGSCPDALAIEVCQNVWVPLEHSGLVNLGPVAELRRRD